LTKRLSVLAKLLEKPKNKKKGKSTWTLQFSFVSSPLQSLLV
jgi:hypothetical protein